MKTSGFNLAHMQPIGAVLSSITFCVPSHYSVGTEFNSHEEALAYVIAKMQGAVARHDAWYGDQPGAPGMPERITIDIRWTLDNPAGGSWNGPAERYEYVNIAEAQGALAHRMKFSPEVTQSKLDAATQLALDEQAEYEESRS
jgi:hypothetical protein